MTFDELKEYLAANFADDLTLLDTGRHEPVYEVKAEKLVTVCRRLREDETLKFDFFCNLGGVDTGERMEAVYSLASYSKKIRVDLKVILPHEKAEIDSVQEVWPAANWYERELWELYGVHVKNHGNLTRFLLPDDWDQGFPMRKDWDAPDFIRMPEL
ncbi:MAG: NADH-quinone oxidoreductase subunit C [bacterium]|nr:NADH-quinone oxidoreductase subunit C [bacterium]